MAEENKNTCSKESCEGCAHAATCSSKKTDMHEPANPLSHVKKVIGVVSGKGGVGKSMITASIARVLVKQGYKVGILDADITGPSIPMAFGVAHEKAGVSEDGKLMIPARSLEGVDISCLPTFC